MSNTVWDSYWRKQWATPGRDEAMNYLLATILVDRFRSIKSRLITSSLELGAGSGRASRYLNLMGATTGVLDVSEEAIAYSRHIIKDVPNAVSFYLNDIFNIDYDSIPIKYDLCWNAGVLEHFPMDQQKKAIGVMAEIINDDGLVVIFTPYSGSLFYRIGKFILESLNRFPYGEEIPVHSMESALPSSVRLVEKEKSVGFLILVFNAFKALSYFPLMNTTGTVLYRIVNQVSFLLLSQPHFRKIALFLDRILSGLFGGYLLMSILRKNIGEPRPC